MNIASGATKLPRKRTDPFAATANVDQLFNSPDGSRARERIIFDPGTQTSWHASPFGQTLIVLKGYGWVERRSGSIEEIRTGDAVWLEPGETHRFGAEPTGPMTVVAVQRSIDG